MSIRQALGAALTLAIRPLPWILCVLAAGVVCWAPGAPLDAQTVESAPTNCCVEVYWAGWELGRLQAIANYQSTNYLQGANLHMQRVSTTVQAANQLCTRYCQAWSGWLNLQQRIADTSRAYLTAPEGLTLEKRRSFYSWATSRPIHWVEGVKQCRVDEGLQTKWLRMGTCSEAYFMLGVHIGRATYAFDAAGQGVTRGIAVEMDTRRDGLDRLDQAVRAINALRDTNIEPELLTKGMYCVHLWDPRVGIQSLMAEATHQPSLYSTAQLGALARQANELILGMLLGGRPDLSLSPCPIGPRPAAPTAPTAPAAHGPITIVRAEAPRFVVSDAPRENLVVEYGGDPAFPVRMVFRPRTCPAGFSCATLEHSFTAPPRDRHLVAREWIYCYGSRTRWLLDYEVVLQDRNGNWSNVVAVPAECIPQGEPVPQEPTRPRTAADSGIAIVGAQFPRSVVSDGPKGDLVVEYGGSPVFPVEMVLRPRSCPPEHQCATLQQSFGAATSDRRLVAAGWIYCYGSADSWLMDYEVILRDSAGNESRATSVGTQCLTGG